VDTRDSGDGGSPFISATVAGKPLMLLVDTGATRSILPASFARSQNLRRWPGATDVQMVDANGDAVWMSILPDVPVQFEGEPNVVPMDFLMNPAGNDAILVPQALLGRGWAMVIDLERRELSYEPEEAVLGRLGADGTPLQHVEYRTCGSSTHRSVRASVNGATAYMLLDTGAEHTVLARNHPALTSMMSTLGSRGSLVGITSTGQGLKVDDVAVDFAGASATVSAVVIPANESCWKGILGVDVLRHCTLVWGWSSLWAACRRP
jgi:hypothetical protein